MAERIRILSDTAAFDERSWPALLAMARETSVTPTVVDGAVGDAAAPEWDLYAAIAGGRQSPAFVIGQLGQSLDGRIATASGNSRYINGQEAIRHLHRLRALVDAVIVGVSTVICDDPLLTVRCGVVRQSAPPGPARVVIDPHGRLPPDARVLANDGVAVYVVQANAHPRPGSVTPVTLAAHDGLLDPHEIIAAIAARGYRRILIEGGATTVSCFLAAGAINRLHICVAPIVIGSGKIGITLPPIDCLASALRPAVSVHRLGCDTLFDCVIATQTDSGPENQSSI